MADFSGSTALPSESETFSKTSSTKSSLRVVVPPRDNTASFSCNRPTKSILSSGLPTRLSPTFTPIIASSPASTLTESSPSGTLPPFSSTTSSLSSTPTKLSPFPPSSRSPAELSPTAALPFSLTTRSSFTSNPTELSPTHALPPSSNAILPPRTISPSTTAPSKLSLSPASTQVSPTTALPPSTTALPHSPSSATSSATDTTVNVSDLECCIHDVMSALIEKEHKCRFVDRGHKLKEKRRLVESGTRLKDTVQHVSSDFSKVFGTISEGAQIINDKRSCPTMLHRQGHSVATEIIKDVSNIHWAAIGLFVLANVLERFDKISVNDRDCFDLLKVMFDLAKVLKQLKDNSFDLHKEIAEKMVDALGLISDGAKSCRSFISYNKILKFFFTTKIRDDLLYMRREMDSAIVQLSLQIQIKDASFNNSRRQSYSDASGVHSMLESTRLRSEKSATTNKTIHDDLMFEPAGLPSGQPAATNKNVQCELATKQSTTTTDEIVQCEAWDAGQTETSAVADSRIDSCTTDPNIVRRVNEGDSDRPHRSKRRFFRLPACFNKLKDHTSHTQIKKNPAKKIVVGISLDKREISSFSIEDGCGGIPTIHFTLEELRNATNGFRHQLKSSHARFNLFKGTLPSGKQVIVRTFRTQEASSSEQDDMKILLNELGCMQRLQHKNIVKLMGFCNIEKEEPILVYDYPPNGNLCDFLSDSKKKKVLDWSERSKVLLGVISALIYLHEAADEHTYWVHTDIKPHNILLDGNFNAKLSDFSFAKAFTFDDSSSGDGRMFSTEVDIFSFGILVLQVISGWDSLPRQSKGDALDLRMKAWRLYKEECLHELIDPELLEREGCEFRSIIRSIEIGMWCIVTDPSLRPKTSQVFAMLSRNEEIPPLPDECIISMEPHSDECHQSHESDGSVRSVEDGPPQSDHDDSVPSVEGRHFEMEIAKVEEPWS